MVLHDQDILELNISALYTHDFFLTTIAIAVHGNHGTNLCQDISSKPLQEVVPPCIGSLCYLTTIMSLPVAIPPRV